MKVSAHRIPKSQLLRGPKNRENGPVLGGGVPVQFLLDAKRSNTN